jgi:UrcA family protein
MPLKSALNVLTAVLALGFAIAAQHATAQTADSVSIKVSYGDLNPATEAGAKVLRLRLRDAARTVCSAAMDDPREAMYAYRPCVNAVTGRAIARVDRAVGGALNSGGSLRLAMTPASGR